MLQKMEDNIKREKGPPEKLAQLIRRIENGKFPAVIQGEWNVPPSFKKVGKSIPFLLYHEFKFIIGFREK